ncbi:hypothetical protein [Arenicella chitinivorans]|uniref:hypothetical protein n=1 Tax=Arenicella chitinivorans TaxID=1329800 RepID=UPI0016755FE2|nr:hypothetical protein [Arenicella chitinivorans]
MQCFQHQAINAVGLCKSCLKGVCQECATEVPTGLVCSSACADHAAEMQEMHVRGLKIYGIGQYHSKMPSTGVLVWFLLSMAMWVSFFHTYIQSDYVNVGSLTVAAIFTVILLVAWFSARRTGIKC